MLTYYAAEDLHAAESQDGGSYTLLDRAIRSYRLILSNKIKALRVDRNGESLDLVRCIPIHPHDSVGEDVMVLDFLDHPDWRADRAITHAARTLADKLHIRYCLFRGCVLPVPVTDKLPRNLRDLRLWSTVPGDPATAVRWVEVAGVGRLSPGEFRRRYRAREGTSFTYPLILRITAHIRRPNGRCRDLKLLPWEFHLMARAREEERR